MKQKRKANKSIIHHPPLHPLCQTVCALIDILLRGVVWVGAVTAFVPMAFEKDHIAPKVFEINIDG